MSSSMVGFHAHFWLNVADLWHSVRESCSDKLVEELDSPKVLFESLSSSLELKLHVSIII